MRIGALIIAFLLAFPAFAEVSPRERMSDPALEVRAQTLYREIRCVACQNQSIADSNAEIAKDLRTAIRVQLEEGKSDADITGFLHERYGDFILMTPPVRPGTWLLWAGPFVVLIIGGFITVRMFRQGGKA